MYGYMRARVKAQSFAQAVAEWECANPRRPRAFRDSPSYKRTVDGTRTGITVRRGPTGEVIFRLIETDVVTWWPDESITIIAYASKSTDLFANSLLPDNVRPHFTWRAGELIAVGSGYQSADYYRCPDGLRLVKRDDGYYHVDPEGPTEPFKLLVLDKSKAHRALKRTSYHDYVAWRKMAEAMRLLPTDVPFEERWAANRRSVEERIGMLERREEWPILAKSDEHRDERMRLTIYAMNECYSVEERDSLLWTELGRAERSDMLRHMIPALRWI